MKPPRSGQNVAASPQACAVSSTFAEYVVGATIDVDGERARVPDNYLVRNLTGVIFPGRFGDIQVFTSVSVGHGKGLRVFEEELLWGGGMRLAFF